MLFCLVVLLKYLMAASRFVPFVCGSNDSNSLTINNACGLPFFGGIYFSTLLLKKITPTLSLLLTALKAKYCSDLGDQFFLSFADGAKQITSARIDKQHECKFPFFLK